MAAPAALSAGATEAQALAYLSATYKNTYTNTAVTPYQGMNASQIYAYLKARSPSATPYQLATATADLLLSSAVGGAVGAEASGLAGAVGATETGLANASFLPPWAGGLANFLSALGSGQLWIRVAKVIVGGGLVLIGVAHMSGADNAVASVARKVPLPV